MEDDFIYINLGLVFVFLFSSCLRPFPVTCWKILTSHFVSEVDESDRLQSQQVQRSVHVQRSHLRGRGGEELIITSSHLNDPISFRAIIKKQS